MDKIMNESSFSTSPPNDMNSEKQKRVHRNLQLLSLKPLVIIKKLCCLCHATWDNEKSLLAHFRTKHPEIVQSYGIKNNFQFQNEIMSKNKLKCPHCLVLYMTQNLYSHMEVCKIVQPYDGHITRKYLRKIAKKQCCLCSDICENEESLYRHFELKHSEIVQNLGIENFSQFQSQIMVKNKLQCPHCSVLITKYVLTQHMSVCKILQPLVINKSQCSLCMKKCLNHTMIYQHFRVKHPEITKCINKEQCSICLNYFAKEICSTSHLNLCKKVHTFANLEQMSCKICKNIKSYKVQQKLYSHITKKHAKYVEKKNNKGEEELTSYNECEEGTKDHFKNETVENQVSEKDELENSKEKCQQCSKVFPKGNAIKHQKICKILQDQNKSNAKTDPKQQCPVCANIFSDIVVLREHLPVCKKVYRFANIQFQTKTCKICRDDFSSQGVLYQHILRKHATQCESFVAYCEERKSKDFTQFQRKFYRRIYSRYHCSKCAVSFGKRATFLDHLRIVHHKTLGENTKNSKVESITKADEIEVIDHLKVVHDNQLGESTQNSKKDNSKMSAEIEIIDHLKVVHDKPLGENPPKKQKEDFTTSDEIEMINHSKVVHDQPLVEKTKNSQEDDFTTNDEIEVIDHSKVVHDKPLGENTNIDNITAYITHNIEVIDHLRVVHDKPLDLSTKDNKKDNITASDEIEIIDHLKVVHDKPFRENTKNNKKDNVMTGDEIEAIEDIENEEPLVINKAKTTKVKSWFKPNIESRGGSENIHADINKTDMVKWVKHAQNGNISIYAQFALNEQNSKDAQRAQSAEIVQSVPNAQNARNGSNDQNARNQSMSENISKKCPHCSVFFGLYSLHSHMEVCNFLQALVINKTQCRFCKNKFPNQHMIHMHFRMKHPEIVIRKYTSTKNKKTPELQNALNAQDAQSDRNAQIDQNTQIVLMSQNAPNTDDAQNGQNAQSDQNAQCALSVQKAQNAPNAQDAQSDRNAQIDQNTQIVLKSQNAPNTDGAQSDQNAQYALSVQKAQKVPNAQDALNGGSFQNAQDQCKTIDEKCPYYFSQFQNQKMVKNKLKCPHCSLFITKYVLKKHMTVCKILQPFVINKTQCSLCERKFSDQRKIYTHFRNKHLKITQKTSPKAICQKVQSIQKAQNTPKAQSDQKTQSVQKSQESQNAQNAQDTQNNQDAQNYQNALKPLSVTRNVSQDSSAYMARVVSLQTDAVVATETRLYAQNYQNALKPLSVTRNVNQNSSACMARVVSLQTDTVVATETRFYAQKSQNAQGAQNHRIGESNSLRISNRLHLLSKKNTDVKEERSDEFGAYKCQMCLKSFYSIQGVKVHVEDVHKVLV